MFRQFICVCATAFFLSSPLSATDRNAFRESDSSTRIVAVGDSITWNPGQNYRSALAAKLNTIPGFKWEYVGGLSDTNGRHQAMNGAVIGPGNSWLPNDAPPDYRNNVYDNLDTIMSHDPDIVLILIGVNDLLGNYQAPNAGQNGDGKSAERLEAVVRKILTAKHGVTILLSNLLPTTRTNVSSHNTAIAALVNKLKGEGSDVWLVDMHKDSGIVATNTADLYDGLHPTAAGGAKMANVWFQVLEKIANPPETRVEMLVPYPKSVIPGTGSLTLTASSRIIPGTADLIPHAETLREEIYISTGTTLTIAPTGVTAAAGDIVLSTGIVRTGIVRVERHSEWYSLNVANHITVSGQNKWAVSLGTSTLIQLLGGTLTVPKIKIEDEPDAPYRALSIDVARRFTSIPELKKIIKMARMSKINYIQLHLTDDQNWMFPSAHFPNAGLANRNSSGKPAYTKKELVDLEAYAVANGVMLIPELDMPGHCGTLTSVYPGEFDRLGSSINIASEKARANCLKLIGEAMDIFQASPYYHVGGDEVSFTSYVDDPHMQTAIARLRQTYPAVQSNGAGTYAVFRDFMNHIDAYVKSRGKTLIAWEGVRRAEDNNTRVPVSKDIIWINWEHSYYHPTAMLDDGYTVINGSWHPYYVCDHYPRNNVTMASPAELYRYNRFMFGHCMAGMPGYQNPIVTPSTSNVIGSMMAWWEGDEWNLVPLMRSNVPPHGEKLWNDNINQVRDFSIFSKATNCVDAMFDRLISPVTFDVPMVQPSRFQYVDSTQVTMTSTIPGGQIRYTTNGTEPTTSSTQYTNPVMINTGERLNPATVKAALFVDGVQVGQTRRIDLVKVALKQDPLNVAFGKAVWTNGDDFPNNPPNLLTDGVVSDHMAHWLAWHTPQEVVIDLMNLHTVGSVRVYSAWNQTYADKFEVLVAENSDGPYTLAASRATNSTNVSANGYLVEFDEPHKARYVMIRSLPATGGIDAGKARVVEVDVYETNPLFGKAFASNGKLWLEFTSLPDGRVTAADFAATMRQDGTTKSLALTNFVWDGTTRTATFDFVSIPRQINTVVATIDVKFRKNEDFSTARFEVPGTNYNLARGVLPTLWPADSPDDATIVYRGTDGDFGTYANLDAVNGTFGYLQLDFGMPVSTNKIVMLHYPGRTYRDVVHQFSNDPNFAPGNTVTVFNNSTNAAGTIVRDAASVPVGSDAPYQEANEGTTFNFKTVTARYFRTWVRGSNTNDHSHWSEVEVWGSPTPQIASRKITVDIIDFITLQKTITVDESVTVEQLITELYCVVDRATFRVVKNGMPQTGTAVLTDGMTVEMQIAGKVADSAKIVVRVPLPVIMSDVHPITPPPKNMEIVPGTTVGQVLANVRSSNGEGSLRIVDTGKINVQSPATSVGQGWYLQLLIGNEVVDEVSIFIAAPTETAGMVFIPLSGRRQPTRANGAHYLPTKG